MGGQGCLFYPQIEDKSPRGRGQFLHALAIPLGGAIAQELHQVLHCNIGNHLISDFPPEGAGFQILDHHGDRPIPLNLNPLDLMAHSQLPPIPS